MPRRPKKRADLEGIGARIRELRGEISQDVFAPSIGIAQSQLSKIERGVLAPSVEVLLRLSKRFQKSVDWILSGEE